MGIRGLKDLGCRVSGIGVLRFRVSGLGFWGFRVWDLLFGVWGLGFMEGQLQVRGMLVISSVGGFMRVRTAGGALLNPQPQRR